MAGIKTIDGERIHGEIVLTADTLLVEHSEAPARDERLDRAFGRRISGSLAGEIKSEVGREFPLLPAAAQNEKRRGYRERKDTWPAYTRHQTVGFQHINLED
ncbi:MAG: hypothetical protein JSR55_16695 [Proteobacteria bacterium]|nr:hypothetical protein [Pseudomonadota bacterium]